MNTVFDIGQYVKFGKGKHTTTAKVIGIEIKVAKNLNNMKDGEIYTLYTLSTNQVIRERCLSPVCVI